MIHIYISEPSHYLLLTHPLSAAIHTFTTIYRICFSITCSCFALRLSHHILQYTIYNIQSSIGIPPAKMKLSSPLTLLSTLTLSTFTLAQDTTIVVTAPVPTSTSYTSSDAFRNSMLTAHNFYRKEHNATDLKWNDTSARFAARWADRCEFEHSVC